MPVMMSLLSSEMVSFSSGGCSSWQAKGCSGIASHTVRLETPTRSYELPSSQLPIHVTTLEKQCTASVFPYAKIIPAKVAITVEDHQ